MPSADQSAADRPVPEKFAVRVPVSWNSNVDHVNLNAGKFPTDERLVSEVAPELAS